MEILPLADMCTYKKTSGVYSSKRVQIYDSRTMLRNSEVSMKNPKVIGLKLYNVLYLLQMGEQF